MIVGVRFHGSGAPAFEMGEGRRIYTIGSGACDLVVPAELAGDVAPVHATIERVEGAIRICDLVSRHGLYRSPRSARVAELLLHAGEVGWVGSCPVLALDRELLELRSSLAWSMGLEAHGAVDDGLVAVASREPLLIVGPLGLDDERLMDALGGSVLRVDLGASRALSAPLAAQLFTPRRDSRVVFRATKEARARSMLDTYLERVRILRLVPLSARPEEIVRLLQVIWRDELHADHEVGVLGRRALGGLAAYRWPGQIDELRACPAAARVPPARWAEGGGSRAGSHPSDPRGSPQPDRSADPRSGRSGNATRAADAGIKSERPSA